MKAPDQPPPFPADPTPIFQKLVARLASGQPPYAAEVDGRYIHWDKLRFKTPPKDLALKEWWWLIKLARRTLAKPLPIRSASGSQATLSLVDAIYAHVHEIDRHASGEIMVSDRVTDASQRDRYIVSSLIEEAIASSQLEGASTTTLVAKKMLRSGRKPRTHGERMILNNYLAMSWVRSNAKKRITMDAVFELHRILCANTLEDPTAAGRFRRMDEPIVVAHVASGEVYYSPPAASELTSRMTRMCEFANGGATGFFLHPVLRAILLHYWLASDHPFVDGNGRTARALFYWSMISSGYWLCEYLAVSRLLKKAPAKYGRSFLYCQTDEHDLTYFVLYHLDVLRRSIDDLHKYLQKKMGELKRAEHLLEESSSLNHRQTALLGHALRHEGADYTIGSHRRSHGVVYQTARTDLLQLADLGLLTKKRIGKAFVFYAPTDLEERLRRVRS